MMKKEYRILQVRDADIIGKNIKRLRKEHHIKQTDFVAQLQLMDINISVYSLSKIENGIQNPTVSLLMAVTSLLNCDYNEFFKETDDAEDTGKDAQKKI